MCIYTYTYIKHRKRPFTQITSVIKPIQVTKWRTCVVDELFVRNLLIYLLTSYLGFSLKDNYFEKKFTLHSMTEIKGRCLKEKNRSRNKLTRNW